MQSIDLTPILQAVIALLAALITYKLVPWIKARTDTQQEANLQATIRVLVYAAEQIYGAGNGKEKLDYVCTELEARGFKVDLSAIEAAVYTSFNTDNLILRPFKNLDSTESDVSQEADDDSQEEPEEADEEPETGRVSNEPPSGAAGGPQT